MNSIKVLHILPELTTGGAEILLADTIQLSNQSNMCVHVCEFYGNGKGASAQLIPTEYLISLASKHGYFHQIVSLFRLIKIIRKGKYQILHLHLMLKHIILLKSFLPGIKMVCTLHSNVKYSYFILSIFDAIIACGRAVYNAVQKGVIDKKLFYIMNVINQNRVISKESKSFLRKLWKIDENDVVLLSVGRLVKPKNHEFMIKAMNRMVLNNTAITLLIAGDGPLRDELLEYTSQYNLGNHIRFLGNVKEIEQLYGLADIYVNTSTHEGLALTIVEAMANGIPVIASDIESNKELQENNSIQIFESANLESYVNKVNVLIENKNEYYESSQAARAFFTSHFSIENFIESQKQVYLNLLQSNSEKKDEHCY